MEDFERDHHGLLCAEEEMAGGIEEGEGKECGLPDGLIKRTAGVGGDQ